MEEALASLARLDAAQGSNVAEVAASVAAQLGLRLEAVQGLVSEEATCLRERVKAMEASIKQQATSNAAVLGGKMDELARLFEAQRAEQLQRDAQQRAMHTSPDTFDELFDYAPLCSPEEWVALHGEEAADDDDEERSELGRGTFGTTYRLRARPSARERQQAGVEGGQLFAVKVVLKKELRRNKMGKHDVDKEVAVHERMRHVHIIAFLKVFEMRDGFYLVMELAEGGTLAGRIGAALSASDAWRWSLQLARVLEFIHGLGMAHRYLHPQPEARNPEP